MRTFAAVRDLAAQAPVEATVRGGSMAPLLKDGDRVAIARARLYLPGDVVAFRAGDGRIVVHRLLGYRFHLGRLAGVAQGDAAPLPDPPFPLEALLGRVVSHPGPLSPWSARWAARWTARWTATAAYLAYLFRAARRVLGSGEGR